MGVFDFFKSTQKRVAALAATMSGVDPKGITPMTEASEWMAELKEDDIRRQRVPPELLEPTYYLFSNNREYGTVVRVDKEFLHIRLPYDLDLPSGIKIPHSHVFRKLPIRALAALDGQRAQKVIRNVLKDATKCYNEHVKLCQTCFSQVPPRRYPGDPELKVLGPPADKFTVCASCLKKEEAKLKLAAEAAAKAKAEQQQQRRR